MKIALLQLNLTVGDLSGNGRRLAEAVRRAGDKGADLCLAPELAVTGYPPRDLLLNKAFVRSARTRLENLAKDLKDLPPLLVGFPEESDSAAGKPLFNSAALLREGQVAKVFRKTLLPTYDVFDEHRYFQSGFSAGILEMDGLRLGVTICEDVWNDKRFWEERFRYPSDPVEDLAAREIDVLVNISASPFSLGKQKVRFSLLSSLAKRHHVPVFYVNQVGGNDDLVFDGQSMVLDNQGRLAARAGDFEEDLVLAETDAQGREGEPSETATEAKAYAALVTGTRDYARKCGFSTALLGLSGGIDSSLTAAIAAQALGPENVTGVLMPSPYSSQGSIKDSLGLAVNLGIRTQTIPIAELMVGFDQALAPVFAGRERDVTEENIQSRIRGNLLMAMSNKFGSLLLTTGNKSELSVGYCTIYGDMAGGLAVIADAPKTLVFSLCRWINARQGEVIPKAVLEKPPSAELRPDQVDQDSLPPYEILDAILERLVERRLSAGEIKDQGYDPETVDKVARLVRIAEFKRRQAPPCIKITDRAFGTGWRMPVAGCW